MADPLPVLTHFDAPGRAAPAQRSAARVRLIAEAAVPTLLECTGSPAVIVNTQREILLANEAFAELCGAGGADLVGRRIGEAVGCIHAAAPPAGCGTTEACVWCGAAHALRAARIDRTPQTRECRIRVRSGPTVAPLNTRIRATPVTFGDTSAIVVVLSDIADEQRREVLERMFYHDVLNAAGGLQGLMESWTAFSADEVSEIAPAAAQIAASLVEQIKAHRDLTAAERGTLPVRSEPVGVGELCRELRLLYASHEVGSGKRVVAVVPEGANELTSDGVLLRRVLGNLLKNALEASQNGDTVTLAYESDPAIHVFTVHNPAVMPEGVRQQVFQRAFSTKGRGRGLGTYGAKLIAERYLEGLLGFTSTSESGTTFTLTIPR